MKTLLLTTSLALSSALTSQLANADSIDNIDAAANQMDVNTLKSYSQQDSDYSQAYANYRLAITANIVGQPQLAVSALQDAKASLENLTASSSNADNQALLSAVYGMLIALDNSKAAVYGPKAERAIEQAKQLDATNPRVALVQAISAFNTPAMYGGSMQRAADLAGQAIELYANPCDNICWGHAEAYTWRGLAKQNLGDIDGALADWQQALAVESDYAWAQFLLKQNGQPVEQSAKR
ncbi:tetratricopeptide repeat protein [Shewanella fidelis]|uniref:Tetratricopeptide repeat protein n=1 Tax=Shewanella fidelis TaxID=173509 RepID=A0AAW8NRV9_9GAMM|nr:hypothetical protein [Shewanella fidelis]MDR8525492.1 hypothetical protein [Shewanella fidelis]MDW4813189.1 hypothetical protein [Shewanella fidelis]MDW4816931.1 hypothetical protein [Shewanella fidelis]MDW4820090.1 hypothetical protein [Shewanella fidelis]MDW4825654.1 hypothetical protein [Shewanella fidelis]